MLNINYGDVVEMSSATVELHRQDRRLSAVFRPPKKNRLVMLYLGNTDGPVKMTNDQIDARLEEMLPCLRLTIEELQLLCDLSPSQAIKEKLQKAIWSNTHKHETGG